MKSAIKSKLETELRKDINNEVQIIYILSRVRKILEIENSIQKFKTLNFYCNWALHAKLDRANNMPTEIIPNFDTSNSTEEINFLSHTYFHIDFKKFLIKEGIETQLYSSNDNLLIFNRILTEIYSDTPLIIAGNIQKRITISSGVNSNLDRYNSVSYVVEDL